jgi:hypothetical protein
MNETTQSTPPTAIPLPPTYTGQGDVNSWDRRFRALKALAKWSEDDTMNILSFSLDGEASVWFDKRLSAHGNQATAWTVEKVMDKLVANFQEQLTVHQANDMYGSATLTPNANEDPVSFTKRFNAYYDLIPEASREEQVACNYFVGSIASLSHDIWFKLITDFEDKLNSIFLDTGADYSLISSKMDS